MNRSKSSSSVIEDPETLSLLRQLDEQAADLDQAMESFMRQRAGASFQQERALMRYEQDMRSIEEESYRTPHQIQVRKNAVDHNVMKHLNLDRHSEEYLAIQDQLANRLPDEPPEALRLAAAIAVTDSYVPQTITNGRKGNRKEDLNPSFEEKKKLREMMFSFLDESSIEETRLELEIETARENNEFDKADALSEALFLLQRIHNERLNRFMTSYKPQPYGKVWGNDPEYNQLSKQLYQIANRFNAGDSFSEADSLPPSTTSSMR